MSTLDLRFRSAAVLLALLRAGAQAADLTVEVLGARSAQGSVAGALFASGPAWLKPGQAVQGQFVPAADKAVLLFRNLAPGRYAVSVYHDENGSAKLDTNPAGMPTERYGFSRDAQGRFVRTEKYLADTAAGRPVRAAFGTNPSHAEPTGSADAINVANTSVLLHDGELLALWEGGSATRIDAQTLETRGLKTWTPEYAGMPFSAHPRVERDGSLWNFGVSSAAGLLSIYHVSQDGRDVRTASLPIPDIAMVHDFAVTERHLVFLLPPLVFDVERLRAGQTFLASHVWRPALGMRVLVLSKDQLDAPQWFRLPAGFVFHIGNAWEDTRRGVIRLDYIRSPDAWWASATAVCWCPSA